MISDASAELIRDVFGKPEFFQGAARISKRLVGWGDAAPVELEHSAIVVSERRLLEELGEIDCETTSGQPDFCIHASGTPPGTVMARFGARSATAARVVLKQEARAECRVESVPEGWLFLIPNAQEEDWLLAIGGDPETLLGRSRIIAPVLDGIEVMPGEFSTCPGILSPLCGGEWLACGSAAAAFDPICGDGTANAIREAILAAAVIRGIAAGEPAGHLFEHYQTRLMGAMRRHLSMCSQFYATGGSGSWWREQTASLQEGFDWCGARLESIPPPRYRLQDYELRRLQEPSGSRAGQSTII